MKNLYLLTVAILLLLGGTSQLSAQAPSSPAGDFRIGVSGGATYNFHKGGRSGWESGSPFEDCGCDLPIEERGQWGYSIGLTAEYVFTRRFSLASHVLYSTHPRSAVSSFSNAKILVPGWNPNSPEVTEGGESEIKLDAEYNLLSVDMLGKARVLSLGNTGIGLAFGFAVAQKEKLGQTEMLHLITPENARLVTSTAGYEMRDSGRTMVFLEDAPIKNASPVRFSLRTGLFFEFEFFDRLYITPGAYYDNSPTPVVKDSQWMLDYAMLQLDVTARL